MVNADIPDTKLARAITEYIRDCEADLLFHHSTRVFLFGALAGKRLGLRYDPELLYAGAMFHDLGLTERYWRSGQRFEVDGANAARDFLNGKGLEQTEIDRVWLAIALHTTPGVPEHMNPEIALIAAGVDMDVEGIGYHDVSGADRERIVAAHPRGAAFKHRLIDTFYQGVRRKPDSTIGTVNEDVLVYKDPHHRRSDFCSAILGSAWAD